MTTFLSKTYEHGSPMWKARFAKSKYKKWLTSKASENLVSKAYMKITKKAPQIIDPAKDSSCYMCYLNVKTQHVSNVIPFIATLNSQFSASHHLHLLEKKKKKPTLT